ncbi:stage III sporulation protein AF [Paenibacillus sp. HN-1]|uniref:stage III sporulation protein AF n=1 Tax=Paenibacillus TaxID=44249 RepID=UPI001CA910E1|nr:MULTISPECIES: stage III sporulation protein AF [Paenibacillus]MBY9081493.1 stage III sporulation protein AF [Paenibacillus sp. CGMCC 1.18879]MBY9085013.1 stage III sporulation protein AF [Paenibacillus sinensis]
MSWLSGWLREIILIVLLAGFIELLLPSKSMERYARLVLSLLVLLTILSPIVSLLKGDAASQLSLALSRTVEEEGGNSGKESKELAAILANGRKLASGSQEQSLKLAAGQIAGQMKEEIAAATGRRGVKVSVSLGVTGKDGGDVPVIKRVDVSLSSSPAAVGSGNAGSETGSPITVEPVAGISVQIGDEQERQPAQQDVSNTEAGAQAEEDRTERDTVTALLAKNWNLDRNVITVTGTQDKQSYAGAGRQ